MLTAATVDACSVHSGNTGTCSSHGLRSLRRAPSPPSIGLHNIGRDETTPFPTMPKKNSRHSAYPPYFGLLIGSVALVACVASARPLARMPRVARNSTRGRCMGLVYSRGSCKKLRCHTQASYYHFAPPRGAVIDAYPGVQHCVNSSPRQASVPPCPVAAALPRRRSGPRRRPPPRFAASANKAPWA